MHGLAHDFSGDMWGELDDRRPHEDEPPDPEPMTGWWPPRRPVYPPGLHANPDTFPPPDDESKED